MAIVSSLFFLSIHGQEKTVSAEDTPIYQLFDISLEDILNVDIISATLQKQSVLDAPANAYIITEEQIRMRGYHNLVDLLAYIPQVELQLNSDSEHRNTVTMRGIAGNEKLLSLLNGNRITPATGDFYTLGQQFSLQAAKRVEVIIGPASALYGVDAFAGIVNIITKNRQGEFHPVEASYRLGNFGSSNLTYSSGHDFGDIQLYVSGMITQSENPYYPKYYPNHYAWYTNQFQPYGYVKQSTLHPQILNAKSFEYEAGDSFYGQSLSRDFEIPSYASSFFAEVTIGDITVGYSRFKEWHSSSYGVDPSLTSYDQDARILTTQDVVNVEHLYESFDKRLAVQSRLNFNLHEIHPESQYANVTSMWQRGYIYGYSSSGKLTEQATYRFSDKVNLTMGGSLEFLSALPRTALSPKPFEEGKTLGEQVFYYIGAAGYLPLQYYDNGDPYPDLNHVTDPNAAFQDSLTLQQVFHFIHYFNTGAYGQLVWSLNPQMDLTLGSRYDANTRYGNTFNPRAGFVWKSLDNHLHFKFMYGQAFLAPSPSKSFKQEGSFFGPSSRFLKDGEQAVPGTFLASSFHYPNPDLKPERLATLETSVSYLIGDHFSLDVNAFSSIIRDNINLFAPYDDTDEDAHVFTEKETTSANAGNLEVKGVSVGGRVFYKFGKVQLNSFANFFLMEGNSRGLDNQLVDLHFYQAEKTLKSGIELWSERFYLSTRLLWKNYTLSNPQYPYEVPGYIQLNGSIGADLLSTKYYLLNLNLSVTNIADSRFYNAFYGSLEGFEEVPQDPRRFMVGVNLKWK